MYHWIKLDVTQIPLCGISGIALKCFLALASSMGEDQRCQCTYKLLAQSLGVSRRSALRAISELERADLIVNESFPGVCLSIAIKKGATVGRNSDPGNLPGKGKPAWKSPTSDTGVTLTP